MRGEDLTLFEQDAAGENVYLRLTKKEIDEVEANPTYPESSVYMEPLALENRNSPTWAGVEVTTPWMQYTMMSQPTNDKSLYKSQIFYSKREVVHVVRRFP